TLKFLGEISDEQIGGVKEKLQEIKLPLFQASLGEVGTFSKKFRD
ncbi:MAG: RNA 2',3'-cyclic phosphodiesterase, partial [DPANN group archaeon]|nr:RNA 2',3'-cyclic phosphodiesterase [DPANN group archaeon]